jgi:hypothetical protein
MAGPSEPDTAMLGARAILPLGKGVKLSLAYDGKLGSGYTAHSGNLGSERRVLSGISLVCHIFTIRGWIWAIWANPLEGAEEKP